jgi:RNA polymerase sigma-70 factor (ECF subfamily)
LAQRGDARDRQQIVLFLDGDRSSFDSLIGHHKAQVYNLVCHMVGDPEWAKDVTTEVLIQIYRSLGKFRGDCTFRTWMYRVTLNVCRQELRRRQLQKVPESPLVEEIPDKDMPFEQLAAQVLVGQVRETLALLPEKQRAAVVLFFLEELTYKEISAILQVPINTVKARVFQGVRSLRNRLKDTLDLGATEGSTA